MNLREAARGEDCYVMLDEVCNHNPETVVLAHTRIIGVSGMGLKSPDALACPACSCCHDAIDRRRYMHLDRDFVQLAHLRGVLRWQAKLIRNNKLKW